MEWEEIDSNEFRAKVIGGWVLKVHEHVFHMTDTREGEGWDWRVAITFIPDINHEWVIDKKEVADVME